MNIKKIRKKVKNKKWVNSKLKELYKKLKKIHTFKVFECDEFFVGSYLAKSNNAYYRKEYKRTLKHIKFLKRCGGDIYNPNNI